MTQKKTQNFIQGAGILFLAMVIVKILGAVFKIPLANVLQERGMAYFNASYNLFIMLYSLTVTGLTTAVARMVAACSAKQRYRDCRNILRVAKRIFLALGLGGMLVMFLCARLFANTTNVPQSIYAIIVMAPAILFSCLMATYRGYYEGLLNMTPSAVSQVVEVVVKLVCGLLFTYLILWGGHYSYEHTGAVFGVAVTRVATTEEAQMAVTAVTLPFAAAGAMLGVTFSTAVGYLYLKMKFKRQKEGFTTAEFANSPNPVRAKSVVTTLIKSALPITVSALVMNLTNMIDLFSIMNRLEYAYTQNPSYFEHLYGAYTNVNITAIATYLFGGYTMAQTVFNLVPSFTALLGKSALPTITSAWVSGDKTALKTNIESVIRMTTLIAFPAGIGLAVLSKPIAKLLYSGVIGAEISVGLPLRMLGIAAIFIALITPLYAILQSLGRFDLPVKFVLIGAVIKLVVNFLLVGIPEINVSGASVGTALCYVIILICSLISLCKITKMSFSYARIFGKSLLAGGVCGGVAWLVSNHLGDGKIETLFAILCAGVAYLFTILFLRVFSRSDIELFPHGKALAKWLERAHFLSKS